MKLNIGYGQGTWGDVRLDVSRRTSANILADAQHLPFKDRSFHEVRAFHVIEHLENPNLALSEWMRVARDRITIRFPIEKFLNKFVSRGLLSLDLRMIRHWKIARLAHKWKIDPEVIARALSKEFVVDVRTRKGVFRKFVKISLDYEVYGERFCIK